MQCLRCCKARSKWSLILLAPVEAQLQLFHGPVIRSESQYADLVAQVQRLRGRIYVEEGAISTNSLTPDGRHVHSADDLSWHLVTVNEFGEALGCARLHLHTSGVSFGQLSLRSSSIARCKVRGPLLWAGITRDLTEARRIGFSYVELGGWAVAEELRNTSQVLQSVLATYAWSRLIGGAIGVSAATRRNGSASILRRLGGTPIQCDGEELPSYFDEGYGCEMEILRFDSRYPSARYEEAVEDLRQRIETLPIVQGSKEQVNYSYPLSLTDDLCKERPTESLALRRQRNYIEASDSLSA